MALAGGILISLDSLLNSDATAKDASLGIQSMPALVITPSAQCLQKTALQLFESMCILLLKARQQAMQ